MSSTARARRRRKRHDLRADVSLGLGPGLWEMEPTSVLQQKGPALTPNIKRGMPLYHRCGENPLDPTTLVGPEASRHFQGVDSFSITAAAVRHPGPVVPQMVTTTYLQNNKPLQRVRRQPASVNLFSPHCLKWVGSYLLVDLFQSLESVCVSLRHH